MRSEINFVWKSCILYIIFDTLNDMDIMLKLLQNEFIGKSTVSVTKKYCRRQQFCLLAKYP